MPFIALGINHKSAPVELREKVAFSPDSLVHALKSCPATTNAEELVILSTCNRTELYVNFSHTANDLNLSERVEVKSLIRWLADFHQISEEMVAQHAYVQEDQDAMAHLMSVACGLDSLIVGEPQILGQVKQAYSEAKNAGQIKTTMERLFDATFNVAKRVRTETEIGENAVSVAFAAVQLSKQIFAKLSHANVLLIGAGETIELVAKHLKEADAKHITVANRTLARAEALAIGLKGEAITISQIPEHLPNADIVISSTASSLPLIGQGMVERAVKSRKHKPILMIDLAVPRDIEAEVDLLDDVFLYTVDDLQNIVEQNVANREVAAAQAQQMISQQITSFVEWERTHQHKDLIRLYRENAEQLKQELLNKALKQIADGEDANKTLESFAFKLSNALMHGPTKSLQLALKKDDESSLALLNQAFGLSASISTKHKDQT
ncbi:glutamyl-tRNA reductase [Glaciecola sp. KUL10]|uniref:glutamyl-tRNA reductase n=1 Tax=Glaciecola sp. (strain KUL10) TaxID=2161813 RepID=UPI000D78935A|nr:glutamyl-tRNA reductase [Glaciecola sp. KUL10]GBL03364.1 shikimate/quinate 5-dehydrogenase [Glaciecola sp. KUL10]